MLVIFDGPVDLRGVVARVGAHGRDGRIILSEQGGHARRIGCALAGEIAADNLAG